MPKCRTCALAFEGPYRKKYCSVQCQFLAKAPDRALPGECWDWTGGRTAAGYGIINNLGTFLLTHRVSYSVFHGPIREDHYVCHRCDNPSCINPAHLFMGTGADNAADMAKKGRSAWKGKSLPVELRAKLSVIHKARNWKPSPEMLTASVIAKAKKMEDPAYKKAVYDKTRGPLNPFFNKRIGIKLAQQ